MKDIDSRLRSASAIEPPNKLPANFTASIVSEIKSNPKPYGVCKRIKEMFMMKKINPALTVILILVIVSILGGITYAAIKQVSLFSLITQPTAHNNAGNHITPSDMQVIYQSYIDAKKSGKSDFSNFDTHITKELADKLNNSKNYDGVVCSQNMPNSTHYTNVDSSGSMVAVNQFSDGSSTKAHLSYDSVTGIFTDITCPPVETADTAIRMQGYYQQYITSVQNNSGSAMSEFVKHTDASLAKKLNNNPYDYSLVICAQNTPAMVTFKDVSGSSMTAVLSFLSGTSEVKLTYDPSTEKFTSITCPRPS